MSFELGRAVLSRLLPDVIDLAKQTGKTIIETEALSVEIQEKSDLTPVTNADLAASKLIEERLISMPGNFPVLSEESENIDFSTRKNWPCYWLVDPLDGTREFINQNGEYSVNIALIYKHEPVLGVIYAPVQGELYYAFQGGGAFKVEGLGSPQLIHVCKQKREPLVVACGNSQPGTEYQKLMKNLGAICFLAMGSSLKSCLIAEGKADLYARLGPTSEWDTAAAQCIVEEAGGRLTDTDLQPLRYNTKESLLNPHFLVYGDKQVNWQQYL
ncbi:MAG: 3'(2'),5'-bisphosphate nucleotidase CysQ [Gammaproteobacteria bacterium]|nr:3'(2'),5'-bisphosphate nucleotidase CysQ [Gammaproteobacteria bacterium]